MIERYAHPEVTYLWSDAFTFNAWLQIERAVLRAQQEAGAPLDTQPLLAKLDNLLVGPNAIAEIRRIERDKTHHDVAAFLEYLRGQVPHGEWLHYGLTSSDLVDTAQGMRFRELREIQSDAIMGVMDQLGGWIKAHKNTVVAGRTHGQVAEPTSLSVRAWHWTAMIQEASNRLVIATIQMGKAKLSGPVGTFAHNSPHVEAEAAHRLRLSPQGAGASQIVPRTTLALWASAAAALVAACSKIAMDLRLMNLLGQVSWKHTPGQVGSSSMAQKNNPIRAEQIAGMDRLAQGYASMLQRVDGWLERDISSSSVERVAVPDLWHVLLHTLKQTEVLLSTALVDKDAIKWELEEHANEAWTHKNTLQNIADGFEYDAARQYALEFDVESYDIIEDARWFVRQSPYRGGDFK